MLISGFWENILCKWRSVTYISIAKNEGIMADHNYHQISDEYKFYSHNILIWIIKKNISARSSYSFLLFYAQWLPRAKFGSINQWKIKTFKLTSIIIILMIVLGTRSLCVLFIIAIYDPTRLRMVSTCRSFCGSIEPSSSSLWK